MSRTFTLDLDSFVDYCERNAIGYVVNEALGQVALPRPDAEGWALRFVPRPERGLATVAFPFPGRIPRERVAEMARGANLLNARTYLGAWVVNLEARELYFRQSVGTVGVQFDDRGLRELLQVVVGSVDVSIERWDRVLQGEPAEVLLEA
jgi:hypothetical protein